MKDELNISKKMSVRAIYLAMTIAILLGMVSGAMALVGAIVYMCDISYGTDGILTLIAPTLSYAGVMAAACAGMAMFCKNLLTKQKKVDDAIGQEFKTGACESVCAAAWILVVISAVTAVAGMLQLLLSANGYEQSWKALMFGNVFPALAGAAGAIGASVMLNKMKKGKITDANATMILMVAACIALLMVIVAMVVKTRESDSVSNDYTKYVNKQLDSVYNATKNYRKLLER